MTSIKLFTERCISTGSCQDVAPDVFDMDDDGVVSARVDEVDGAQRAQAEQAANLCPVQAILVGG